MNGTFSLANIEMKGKVNNICQAFLEVLQKRGNYHLQNVITAHVCKIPADLEAGLRVVAQYSSKSNAHFLVKSRSNWRRRK